MTSFKIKILPLSVIIFFIILPVIDASILASVNNKYGLVFFDLKEKYFSNDKIKFSVSNISNEQLTFYCSVEKFIDNRWREIGSINNLKCSKAVKLDKLDPKNVLKQVWDHNHKCFSHVGRHGTFRFVVYIYSNSDHKIIGKIYSKEFIIFPFPSEK
ncbi:MAG: hypothetical protein HZB23_04915 [Deltaproteobacteria bacterium]|nr:hypothetical protein [Deltaproteobacteria bacterium]